MCDLRFRLILSRLQKLCIGDFPVGAQGLPHLFFFGYYFLALLEQETKNRAGRQIS